MAEKIVIIGGVAAGPKAACRVKRLIQDSEVTIIDQDTTPPVVDAGSSIIIEKQTTEGTEVTLNGSALDAILRAFASLIKRGWGIISHSRHAATSMSL